MGNRASSCVERRISWFFLSCCQKLGVPLKLHQGPQGTSHVATVESDLLSSCKGAPLDSSQVAAGEIGPHLELRRETQCSSPVGTGISGFLLSFNREVGLASC